MRTLAQTIEFGHIAAQYARLRQQHPTVAARHAVAYARGYGDHLSFEQFICETTRGHSWSFTGSAYGGDDDSYHGEGRAYCCYCGADGDA
jgi:hypothetical protein